MMAISIRPAFSPPAECGMHFLKKPATTMASYTGLVARNRSSAVGSNSAALAPASTSAANRRDSSWSSRCGGVSVKSMAMETLHYVGQRWSPMPGVRATIDIQCLTSDEIRRLEVEHGFDNVLDGAHTAHGVQGRKEVAAF